MIRRWWNSLVPFLVLAVSLLQFQSVQAARGVPGSAEFGFGAVVYPSGPGLNEALELAASLELDWLEIPLSWEVVQPQKTVKPVLDDLERVLKFASLHDISILVSISSAPDWAQTGRGPDPDQTAQFVAALALRFPQQIQAVELFPGANTRQGWDATPNAQDYYRVFCAVDQRLKQDKSGMVLVAAGLQPQSNPVVQGNMDDLAFLRDLYALGAAERMPVISIQYAGLTGDPQSFPDPADPRVFRHYESVRRLMAEYQHQNGLIWITHFCLPSGTINMQDTQTSDLKAQVSWLTKAYAQIRSQLYIGVGFLQSLNLEREGGVSGFPNLLQTAGVQHPFTSVLREMIALNRVNSPTVTPGRAKGGSFGKKRP
jgi:hypothetical protein